VRQIGPNGAPSDAGVLHSPSRSEARVRPEMARMLDETNG
jgi:hypothetical protein